MNSRRHSKTGDPWQRWVIHDRVEPTAGPAMSPIPRLRSIFAAQQHFAMCQMRKSPVLRDQSAGAAYSKVNRCGKRKLKRDE
jgi:hypothetical protein